MARVMAAKRFFRALLPVWRPCERGRVRADNLSQQACDRRSDACHAPPASHALVDIFNADDVVLAQI